MNSSTKNSGANLLVIGDLIVYLFSLILTLAIRYGSLPGRSLLLSHLPSFILLFIVFIIVTFSAGLYDKQVAFIRRQIQGILLRVQIINVFIGIVFFYLAPVGIAPKANLFIYFVVSTILLFVWRMVMFPVFSISKKQIAILIGNGEDISDLKEEINSANGYGIYFKEHINTDLNNPQIQETIDQSIGSNSASIVVVDLHNKDLEHLVPYLHSLIFKGTKVIDASKLYESIFDKIPLSMVGKTWLVENSGTSLGNRKVYDFLKRIIDIVVSVFGGLISRIFYPFIILAIKSEDRGAIFILKERVGSS